MTNNHNSSNHTGFIFSLFLHLLILYFVIFGVSFSQNVKFEEQVISFDILPTAEISNIRTKKPQNDEKNEVDAKKVSKIKSDIVKETNKPNEIKPVEESPITKEIPKTQKDEAQIEEKKIDDSESIEKKKTIEKPPAEEKPIIKKEEKKVKEEVKIKKKPNKKIIKNSELDSLLKTLEQASDGDNAKSAKYATKSQDSDALHESKGSYDAEKSFSISEIALIRQQIMRHWNRPIGSAHIDEIKITIHMILNKEGAVEEAKIIKTVCGAASADMCKIVADGAQRAVWQASPLQNLSKERYEVWKEFYFDFTPRD